MSPLGASTNFPGHVTTYFRTSMSEASPPQGPDMWYLTFYQNKVLIYQAIVTNSISTSHFCTKLSSKTYYKLKFYRKSRTETLDA